MGRTVPVVPVLLTKVMPVETEPPIWAAGVVVVVPVRLDQTERSPRAARVDLALLQALADRLQLAHLVALVAAVALAV